MYKKIRIALLILIDIILLSLSLFLALFLRFDGPIPDNFINSLNRCAPTFIVIAIAVFYIFGLYKRIWTYASIGELLSVIYSVTISIFINIGISYFLMQAGSFPFPRSFFIINWLLNIIFIGGSRLAWRLFKENALNLGTAEGRPVLIFGAGDTGVLLAKEMKRHYNGEIRIVGFVDDDPNKQNLILLGIPVLGTREDLPGLISKYDIQEIVIAIPSAEGSLTREIVAICQDSDVKLKILPGVYDLIEENVTVSHIRSVQVEDLLGREPVQVDLEGISGYLHNQVVLVTGAGGSIGSELCRQILKFEPKKLLLLDICENDMYDIELELRYLDANIEIVPLIKDIRDKQAIEQVFEEYKPQVVFHAAAHKHVPLMELNPEEAIKNNVMGTYNVAQAADRWSAKKFVLISTDKAVNPTSIMGASKRLAEIIIQYLDQTSKTNFVAVRFGNVLASRGSVIPLFKKQIAAGGPVTVTHPEMVRYFMTIPEAVELVIQAGALAKGGEIFVLDMGEPVKILDLAKTLIKLSGFEPGKDIEIAFIGIRPGEKLYEELMTDEEGVNGTVHERIYVARPNGLNGELIEGLISNINLGRLPQDKEATEDLLRTFIPTFRVKEVGNKEIAGENI